MRQGHIVRLPAALLTLLHDLCDFHKSLHDLRRLSQILTRPVRTVKCNSILITTNQAHLVGNPINCNMHDFNNFECMPTGNKLWINLMHAPKWATFQVLPTFAPFRFIFGRILDTRKLKGTRLKVRLVKRLGESLHDLDDLDQMLTRPAKFD